MSGLPVPYRPLGRNAPIKKGVPAHVVERAAQVLAEPTDIPFLDLCLWKGRFPSRRAQFCTQELKGRPISEQVHRPHLDAGRVLVSWQGVRWDESGPRKDLPIFQQVDDIFDPEWRSYYVYRPILHLSQETTQ